MKSLRIETSSYGSLLVLVLTSKFPTNIRTSSARKFTGNVLLSDELLVVLKNKLKAKERLVNPADKHFQRGEFSRYRKATSSFHTGSSGSGFNKSTCVFCGANNRNSNRCAKMTNPLARKQKKYLLYLHETET